MTGDGYSKICAKLTSGTQFGVGVAFERTCRSDCKTCTGSAFDRRCRHFTFRPHYDVQLLRGSDATSGHVNVYPYVLAHLLIQLEPTRIHIEGSDRISCIFPSP